MANDRVIARGEIVACARAWIGTPYHHQASVRGVGVDCLGVVRGVWRELYGEDAETPPPYSRDWAERYGQETLIDAARRHLKVAPRAEPEPGDVVVFRYRRHLPAKHVGIATGASSFIHAIETAPVAEVAITDWWRRRIAAVFSFPGVST